MNDEKQIYDFAGADLSGRSFGARDLRGANFRGADLSYAHLGGADLRGADFRNANFYKANLGAAILSGADMRYSDLREANLAGADLTGADLREAIGLDVSAPVPLASLVRPLMLQETDDFVSAKEDGYFPLSHWGQAFAVANGKTLCKNLSIWRKLKNQLGETIFGDRTTFSEVRLVQQYKEYSQWAYMISMRGFLRIAAGLGLELEKRR